MSNLIYPKKFPSFKEHSSLLFLNMYLGFAGLTFLFPEFFLSIHKMLSNAFDGKLATFLVNASQSQKLLVMWPLSMGIFGVMLLIQMRYLNRIQDEFKRWCVITVFSYLAFSPICLVASLMHPLDFFAQSLVYTQKIASGYLCFPTNNIDSLQHLAFFQKLFLFSVMNIGPIGILYLLNKMIFSIDQNNIFKSFSKKDLDRIVHLALFHLVLLKPLGLGYYLFGILRLPQDQAIEMVGQQIMGQLFAALLLYMPLSRIIDAVLSRGAVLEDDTNHTV